MAHDPDAPFPRTWGRYTLTELLGRGGAGEVFGAILHGRGGFEKSVALKVLRGQAASEDLLEEARLGGLLHHPCIVETYDVGVHEDRVFLAMEWVRGPTLYQVMKRDKADLPLATALDITAQLCLGLGHAHGLEVRGQPLGLVHRDVKPRNVLLDPVGLAKVADFGIAQATGFRSPGDEAQGASGTVGYMAPEVMLTGAADARADVFAVATICAELVLAHRLWPRTGGWVGYGRAVTQASRWLDSNRIREALDRALPGLAEILGAALHEDPSSRTPALTVLHDALVAINPGGGSVAGLVAAHRGTSAPTGTPKASGTTGSGRPRTNLGADPTPLVGRQEELDRLIDAASRPGVISLVGPGGIGKTRLVRTAGAGLLRGAPGGVWFVDLAAATSIDEVLQALHGALRFPMTGATVSERVDDAGRAIAELGRAVLILDNYEQLVDVARDLLVRWPQQAPDATFLVTSQRRLGLSSEQIVPIGALLPADAEALFVRRAAATGATIDPTDPAIATIARQLDGLPLAIELAASRARVLTPAQIVDALSERFRVLVDRAGARPKRHQTLQHALDWSWRLLEDWQRAALAQLSVFRASFTVEQAQQVLDLAPWPDAPWSLFVLEELIDRSLLTVVPGPTPAFRMLFGVREFAEARLAEPGGLTRPDGAPASGPAVRDDALTRHGRLFAEFGRRPAVLERHGEDAVAATARLIACSADISFALENACARRDAPIAHHAARAWCDIQAFHGAPGPIPRRLEVVLSLDLAPEERISTLLQYAVACERLGDWEAQAQAAHEGLTLANGLGDHRWIGIFHACRAVNALHHGDRAGAAANYRAGLEACIRAGDHLNEMVFRTNLALHAQHEGQYLEAAAALQENIRLAREHGMLRILADNLSTLAFSHYDRGDPEGAARHNRESWELHESLGQRLHLCECEMLEGWLLTARGDRKAAADLFKAAIRRAREHVGATGHQEVLIDAALWLADADPRASLAALDKAARLVRGEDGGGPLRLTRARALAALGDLDAARLAAWEAIQHLRGNTFRRRALARLTHGQIAARQGDVEAARQDLEVTRAHLEAAGIPAHSWLGEHARVLEATLKGRR